MCRVTLVVERDLELLRCLEDGPCQHRTRLGGFQVCNCPVQRAAYAAAH